MDCGPWAHSSEPTIHNPRSTIRFLLSFSVGAYNLNLKSTRGWILATVLALLLAAPLLPQRYRGRFYEDQYLPPPPDANEETDRKSVV